MGDPVADLIAAGAASKPVYRDEFGMFRSPDDFPPGMIGVISGELARYTDFTSSLCMTTALLPYGTQLRIVKGVDVSGNCNTIVREMTKYDHHEWVWLLGDDHTWSQGTLMRLLDHMYSNEDVDVVVPHCLKRTPNWPPVVYSHQLPPDENGMEWYVPADLPEKGLTRIHAAGSAGMLIKRKVLEEVGDPYFRPAYDAQGLNEDLFFCQRVREAGFKIWCDPAILFGHIAVHWVIPKWGDGGWDVHLQHSSDTALLQPGVHRIKREFERRKAENGKVEVASS